MKKFIPALILLTLSNSLWTLNPMPNIQANVTKGQPLKIAANTYNALLDVARRERPKGGAGGSPVRFGRPGSSHPFKVTKSATAGSVDVAAGRVRSFRSVAFQGVSATTLALSDGENYISLRLEINSNLYDVAPAFDFNPGSGDATFNYNDYTLQQGAYIVSNPAVIATNGAIPADTMPDLNQEAVGAYLHILIAKVTVTDEVVGSIVQMMFDHYDAIIEAYAWVQLTPPVE